jgi:hypothetical protein
MGDFDNVLKETIRKECQKYFGEVGKDQIKKLVIELLPSLDEIITKHVKEHFVFLSNKIKESFDIKKDDKQAG